MGKLRIHHWLPMVFSNLQVLGPVLDDLLQLQEELSESSAEEVELVVPLPQTNEAKKSFLDLLSRRFVCFPNWSIPVSGFYRFSFLLAIFVANPRFGSLLAQAVK